MCTGGPRFNKQLRYKYPAKNPATFQVNAKHLLFLFCRNLALVHVFL